MEDVRHTHIPLSEASLVTTNAGTEEHDRKNQSPLSQDETA